METIEEIRKAWRKDGYVIDFNREPNRTALRSNPSEFQIDKVYRYEGMSDPEDEEVLYAISSCKSGVKGFLANAYGVYAEGTIDNLVEKLKYHN